MKSILTHILKTLAVFALPATSMAEVISIPGQSNLAFEFTSKDVVASADPYYFAKYFNPATGTSRDTTSKIFSVATEFDLTGDGIANLSANMRGVGYDGDPLRGEDWGILDKRDVNFSEVPVVFDPASRFYIKNGLAPNALGSTTSTFRASDGTVTNVEASSILFEMTSDVDILFKGLELRIEGTQGIESINGRSFAISSINDPGTFVVPTEFVDANGKITLSYVWTDVQITPAMADSFKVNVYGLRGSDYGNFSAARIGLFIEPPVAVPEPSVSFFGLTALLGLVARRRRK